MAKCKGCGNEFRILNDVRITVGVDINGKIYDNKRRMTAICEDCVNDTLKYLEIGLEELSVAEAAPDLKG